MLPIPSNTRKGTKNLVAACEKHGHAERIDDMAAILNRKNPQWRKLNHSYTC